MGPGVVESSQHQQTLLILHYATLHCTKAAHWTSTGVPKLSHGKAPHVTSRYQPRHHNMTSECFRFSASSMLTSLKCCLFTCPASLLPQISAVVSIPFWQWFLERFGKKTAAFCGITVSVVGGPPLKFQQVLTPGLYEGKKKYLNTIKASFLWFIKY